MDACTPFWANVSMWGERHEAKTSQAAGCRSMKAQTMYANSAEMIYRTNGYDWIKVYGSISIMQLVISEKKISLNRKTMNLNRMDFYNTKQHQSFQCGLLYLFKFWIITQMLCKCSDDAVSQNFTFNNIYHDNNSTCTDKCKILSARWHGFLTYAIN